MIKSSISSLETVIDPCIISSMMLYLSKSLQISSFTGNLAGAITVGVAGCVPIDKSKFFQSINTHFKI